MKWGCNGRIAPGNRRIVWRNPNPVLSTIRKLARLTADRAAKFQEKWGFSSAVRLNARSHQQTHPHRPDRPSLEARTNSSDNSGDPTATCPGGCQVAVARRTGRLEAGGLGRPAETAQNRADAPPRRSGRYTSRGSGDGLAVCRASHRRNRGYGRASGTSRPHGRGASPRGAARTTQLELHSHVVIGISDDEVAGPLHCGRLGSCERGVCTGMLPLAGRKSRRDGQRTVTPFFAPNVLRQAARSVNVRRQPGASYFLQRPALASFSIRDFSLM